MDRRNLIAGSSLVGLSLASLARPAAAQTTAISTLDKIIKEKVIRIATDTSSPPFGVVGADGKPDGSEVATARQLAKDLGVELDLVQVLATQRIPSLLAGRCDVTLSSISITFDRAKTVAFCNPTGALTIVVFGPKKTAIAKAEEMAGKRIGITRATLEEATVPKVMPKDGRIVWFDDISATIQAVLSGQVDAVAMTEFAMNSVIARNPGAGLETKFTVTRAFYAPIVRQADHELRGWINTWVFLNAHNGVLAGLYKQYTNVDLPELPTL